MKKLKILLVLLTISLSSFAQSQPAKIEMQEAMNFFSMLSNEQSPNVEYIRTSIPSSQNDTVIGLGSNKIYFCNVYGRNLSIIDGDILQTNLTLQIYPNFDGSINEQRIVFKTLDAFYNSYRGEVIIEGYVYTPQQ